MILADFSKFLQTKTQDIIEKTSCTALLAMWVKSILDNPPKTNVEKVIHSEIALATNKVGDYLLIAKSESGRTLTQTLYNFAQSYEQYVLEQWLLNKKASDFAKKNKK